MTKNVDALQNIVNHSFVPVIVQHRFSLSKRKIFMEICNTNRVMANITVNGSNPNIFETEEIFTCKIVCVYMVEMIWVHRVVYSRDY